MNKTYRTVLLSLSVVCMTSGCASKAPSFGESIQAEGKAVAAIGERWEDGQTLMRKGNKKIEKGNEQIEDGDENVAEGKAMVEQGKKLVQDAEDDYLRSTGKPLGS